MADKVVTRFAPSPTGYLHVGGARTALFNWLWARKNHGTFILRIEDTDQKRNTPTATAQVMQDLRWLGITWDEGPSEGQDSKGPNGPYFQSQRREIYDRYIQQLVDQGKAYYCLESVEELAALREEAEEQVGGLVYRRPDRVPTALEAAQAKAEGRPVAVRFAIPQGRPIVIHDLIRGTITFRPQEIGDFVILKGDGFPTYNFACVVDDFLMKVTYVLRGQEHLNNTPCQQVLWETLFGLDSLPKYAHMSVTVSEGGGKLSKRERPKTLLHVLRTKLGWSKDELAGVGGITVEQLQSFLDGGSIPDMPIIDAMAEHMGVHLPEINVVDFSRSGYLPETLVNFLALLGWNPGDNREVMRVEELIESFEISRLTKSNSLFDRSKLLAFNTEHMRMVPKDRLVQYLRAYLEEVKSPILPADDEKLSRLIGMCAGARTLAEIEAKCRFIGIPKEQIQYDKKAVEKVLVKDGGQAVLPIINDRLIHLEPFTEQGLEDMLRGLAEERGVGLGKVAQPLRVALTGTTVSPSIFHSVQLLGVPETSARIQIAIAHVKGSS